jgi:aspartate dehydrogenase
MISVVVVVVGCGAIGSVVARSLRAGEVPGATLAGVVTRSAQSQFPALSLPQAIEVADLVVEAAGQEALADIAPNVLAGRPSLLVVSVGALRDDAVLKPLAAAAPGRVYLATGAIGGLDMLRSAARMGPLDQVRIVTTKLPATLVQPWMTEAEAAALRTATSLVEVKRGPAREIAGAFPASANVAAAVALAVGDWDLEAVVMADPNAVMTSHVITASGTAGEYRFEIRNRPSRLNPKTSEVVPYAVLKAIADIVGGAAWSFR